MSVEAPTIPRQESQPAPAGLQLRLLGLREKVDTYKVPELAELDAVNVEMRTVQLRDGGFSDAAGNKVTTDLLEVGEQYGKPAVWKVGELESKIAASTSLEEVRKLGPEAQRSLWVYTHGKGQLKGDPAPGFIPYMRERVILSDKIKAREARQQAAARKATPVAGTRAASTPRPTTSTTTQPQTRVNYHDVMILKGDKAYRQKLENGWPVTDRMGRRIEGAVVRLTDHERDEIRRNIGTIEDEGYKKEKKLENAKWIAAQPERKRQEMLQKSRNIKLSKDLSERTRTDKQIVDLLPKPKDPAKLKAFQTRLLIEELQDMGVRNPSDKQIAEYMAGVPDYVSGRNRSAERKSAKGIRGFVLDILGKTAVKAETDASGTDAKKRKLGRKIGRAVATWTVNKYEQRKEKRQEDKEWDKARAAARATGDMAAFQAILDKSITKNAGTPTTAELPTVPPKTDSDDEQD